MSLSSFLYSRCPFPAGLFICGQMEWWPNGSFVPFLCFLNARLGWEWANSLPCCGLTVALSSCVHLFDPKALNGFIKMDKWLHFWSIGFMKEKVWCRSTWFAISSAVGHLWGGNEGVGGGRGDHHCNSGVYVPKSQYASATKHTCGMEKPQKSVLSVRKSLETPLLASTIMAINFIMDGGWCIGISSVRFFN